MNLFQQANLLFLLLLCRFDGTKDEGGRLVYIREDIPSRLLNISHITSDIECLGIEVNLRKVKWKPGSKVFTR